MFKNNRKKGFTLIEMLVVIAIIAVLVAIIMPIVGSMTTKAKAASDAANLHAVLDLLNVEIYNQNQTVQEIIDNSANPTSQLDPRAVLCAVYETPGFIDVYYANGDIYYGLDYLSDIALNGSSSISTAKPDIEGKWYTVSNNE